MEFLQQVGAKARAWFEAGGSISVALVVLVVGWIVARFLKRFVAAAVLRGTKDEMLARFTSNVAHRAAQLVVVIAFLGKLGVDTTSLAAMLGGAGVAIGFALRDTLSNLSAGIILILRRPFEKGDLVEAAGVLGFVDEITMAATEMSTLDNKAVVVPNGLLFNNVITNYSAKKTRRVDLVAGIGYDDDQDKAREILAGILRDNPLVLAEPAPEVALIALADSSVNFNVRPWCKTADYWTVLSEVTSEIKRRFDAAGISIPYPQQDVHMHSVA